MDDKQILVELVNLNSTDKAALKQFVADRGPLKKNESIDYVGEWAQMFRFAWTWKSRKENEIQRINHWLDIKVFKAEEPTYENLWERPALRTDFLAGTWQPKARNLLDRLALELIRSRKMLHICENPDCGRYFIKSFSRDRYHHALCYRNMREKGQRDWAKKNRAEINRRRRKPSKKGKAR